MAEGKPLLVLFKVNEVKVMQTLIRALSCVFVLLSSPLLADWMDDPDIVAFHSAVITAITKSQDRVRQLIEGLRDTSLAPSDARRFYVQHAIEVLSTKKIIASKFWSDPVIRSSAVREQMLNLLNQIDILPSDLSYFQSILDSERAKMTPPTMTTTPAPI